MTMLWFHRCFWEQQNKGLLFSKGDFFRELGNTPIPIAWSFEECWGAISFNGGIGSFVFAGLRNIDKPLLTWKTLIVQSYLYKETSWKVFCTESNIWRVHITDLSVLSLNMFIYFLFHFMIQGKIVVSTFNIWDIAVGDIWSIPTGISLMKVSIRYYVIANCIAWG